MNLPITLDTIQLAKAVASIDPTILEYVIKATANDGRTRVRVYRDVKLHIRNGNVVIPGTSVGLLSNPSKMPGRAWGMAAIQSCPGAHFGVNAICGISKDDSSCYATQNAYSWNSAISAYVARYMWTRECMKSERGRDIWVAYMTAAIGRVTDRVLDFLKYFRVHDSGDMFNVAYTHCWQRVCANLSDVGFWIPTRSYRLPAILSALVTLQLLPNVQVKPSALHFGDAPPVIEGLSGGTSAAPYDFTCPASLQGGKCGDCRSCWNVPPRIYAYHGRDVHGLGGDKSHHKGATKGDRNARVAAFMTLWGEHFAAAPLGGN